MIYAKCQSQRNKKSLFEQNQSKYKLDKDADFHHIFPPTFQISEWPLIKKLDALKSLSEEEIEVLMKLHEKQVIIDARKTFLHQETTHKECFIVNSGWACRFKNHENGERQIINFYLPGDIIGPLALVNTKRNYSVASITNLHVSVFRPKYLFDLYAARPNFVLLYMELLNLEDTMLIEQMTCIGWLTAYQRTAYLLLNLYERLKLIGKVKDNTFYAPLTQQLLADTLSLSIVHMNRTIKKLQAANLIKIKSNKIELLDVVSLKQITDN